MSQLREKTNVALATMILVLAIPYLTPGLARFRVARAPWDRSEEPAPAVPAAVAPVTSATGEAALKAGSNQGSVTNALPDRAADAPALDPAVLARIAGSLAVEDPTGHALDAFYAQLARTQDKRPGAVTRILHYGDSVITSDYISGTARRKMQAKFGDSGHGFILIANPWEWYFHNDVVHHAGDGWSANRITGPFTNDHMYGLGGVTFHGGGGALATFGAADKGEFGRGVSRFDVYYLAQPGGGSFEAKSGDKVEKVSTRADARESRVFSLAVPDGPGKMQLRSLGGGDVRLFGVALERDEPGVVYDALGVNGAQSLLWLAQDGAHWKDQMALRKPALVILQFGTNESEAPVFDAVSYEKTLTKLLLTVKAAAEGASVMLAAPLDRADREGGELRTKKIIPKIVASQRKVALANGCAFWNTFQAMGGEGSIARWVKAKPQLAAWDLTHPTPSGAELIGDLLVKALTSGLEAFRSRK